MSRLNYIAISFSAILILSKEKIVLTGLTESGLSNNSSNVVVSSAQCSYATVHCKMKLNEETFIMQEV